jgi:hypothetical protein
MPLLVVELGLTHECITEPSFITPCVAEWPSASAPPLLVRPPMEAAVLGSVDHMARAAGCTRADYSYAFSLHIIGSGRLRPLRPSRGGFNGKVY